MALAKAIASSESVVAPDPKQRAKHLFILDIGHVARVDNPRG